MPDKSIDLNYVKLIAIVAGIGAALFSIFLGVLLAFYFFVIAPKLNPPSPNVPPVALDLQTKVLAAFAESADTTQAKIDAHDACCLLTALSQRIAHDGQRDASKRRFVTSAQIEDCRLVLKEEFGMADLGANYPRLAPIFGDHLQAAVGDTGDAPLDGPINLRRTWVVALVQLAAACEYVEDEL